MFFKKIFIEMLENDLKILQDILSQKGYDSNYISNLIELILNNIENSSLKSIDSEFIYSTFAFELGREKSKEISECFEELKKV